MGLKEAKKYISEHKKRQSDPFLWPDFMTGLPDRPAILEMLDKYYPKLKTHCIAYVSIDNIQPYLVKYGSKNHMAIIQWTAGILKTTADTYKGFVGVLDTHDFIIICKHSDFEKFMNESSKRFKKKSLEFYDEKDLKNEYVMSFSRDGLEVRVGLMELKYQATCSDIDLPKERILTELERACSGKN